MITLYEYVADKNPNGAKNVLNSFGKKAVRRPDILAQQLADLVNQRGKEALYRIASVHPDLELISHHNEYKQSQAEKAQAKDSIFSSAEGQEIKRAVDDLKRNHQAPVSTPQAEKSEKAELMIIGAVVLVGLALVLKK
jgi:hypothetical protein